MGAIDRQAPETIGPHKTSSLLLLGRKLRLRTFVQIQGTAPVTLTGVFSNGFTISQRFVTDRIGDGPNPLADFQRFSPIGLTDLVSLRFSSSDHAFALDNLDTTAPSAVPELATMMLLGGRSGLGVFVRRRRKSVTLKER